MKSENHSKDDYWGSEDPNQSHLTAVDTPETWEEEPLIEVEGVELLKCFKLKLLKVRSDKALNKVLYFSAFMLLILCVTALLLR